MGHRRRQTARARSRSRRRTIARSSTARISSSATTRSRWDTTRFTSEVRPIIGWHLKPIDIIINPIVDTAYDGLGNPEFVPAARIAYNFKSGWTLAAEEYDDYGPVSAFLPRTEQVHQFYGVVDRTWKAWDIEAGIGVGLTNGSDRLTLQADRRARSQETAARQPRSRTSLRNAIHRTSLADGNPARTSHGEPDFRRNSGGRPPSG